MQKIDPQTCRVGTVLGALLYMMTQYQRRRCRHLATAITAHLECLARHPDADSIVREMAQGLWDEWRAMASHSVSSRTVDSNTKPAVTLN